MQIHFLFLITNVYKSILRLIKRCPGKHNRSKLKKMFQVEKEIYASFPGSDTK